MVLVVPQMKAWRACALAPTINWRTEFLQLSEAPVELSRHSTAALLVLGSTLNAPNLFWYAVGAPVGWLAPAWRS